MSNSPNHDDRESMFSRRYDAPMPPMAQYSALYAQRNHVDDLNMAGVPHEIEVLDNAPCPAEFSYPVLMDYDQHNHHPVAAVPPNSSNELTMPGYPGQGPDPTLEYYLPQRNSQHMQLNGVAPHQQGLADIPLLMPQYYSQEESRPPFLYNSRPLLDLTDESLQTQHWDPHYARQMRSPSRRIPQQPKHSANSSSRNPTFVPATVFDAGESQSHTAPYESIASTLAAQMLELGKIHEMEVVRLKNENEREITQMKMKIVQMEENTKKLEEDNMKLIRFLVMNAAWAHEADRERSEANEEERLIGR